MKEYELELLDLLQYKLPVSPRPFDVIAEKLDSTSREVVETARRLSERGIIKRIGFYPNYASKDNVVALVGCKIENVEKLSRILADNPNVTHNYLRNHSLYNVWFTYKSRSKEELISKVSEILRLAGSKRHAILFSKRVYRLSVKYCLQVGVSKAKDYILPRDPPSPEELGVNPSLVRRLSKSIPIEERPFMNVALEYGMSEDEVAELLEELYKKGAISDFGAILNSEALNFKYNAMVVVDSMGAGAEVCEKLAKSYPYATHIVLREVPESWRYDCYFVVQAKSIETLNEAIGNAIGIIGNRPYVSILSLKNLKPR